MVGLAQTGRRAGYMGFDGNVHLFLGVTRAPHAYRCGEARRAGKNTLLARHFLSYVFVVAEVRELLL